MPANTSAVLENIYPLVEKSLSRNGGVKKFKDCVQRFFESRPFIFSNIPNNRIYFGAEQIEDFFNSMAIKREDILLEYELFSNISKRSIYCNCINGSALFFNEK